MSRVAYVQTYLSGSHKVAGENYLRELSSDPCKLASIGMLLHASQPSLVLFLASSLPSFPFLCLLLRLKKNNNRQQLFVCLFVFYSGFHCVALLLLNSGRCPAIASEVLGLKECAFTPSSELDFFPPERFPSLNFRLLLFWLMVWFI